MYVVGSFKHSLLVELVISEIEEIGVSQEQILAIPLDKRGEIPRIFDSMQYSDGESLIDLATILGMIGMLLGAIYGFVLPLGPIFLASIGLATGSLMGFIIKFLIVRRKKSKQQLQVGKNQSTEVVIMIRCQEHSAKDIKRILWRHQAIAVGTVS